MGSVRVLMEPGTQSPWSFLINCKMAPTAGVGQPEARSFFCLLWVQGLRELGHPLLLSQTHEQGVRSEVEQLELDLALIGHYRWWAGFSHCTSPLSIYLVPLVVYNFISKAKKNKKKQTLYHSNSKWSMIV